MAKVEEVTDDTPLGTVPDPEQQNDEDDVHDETAHGAKPNRGEKKCRKAMQKLGLKAVPGINRVTMKRSKNILFTIEHPEVMKSPNAEIYVVFGAAKYEDLNQMAANLEAKNFAAEEPSKKEEAPIETVKEEVEEEDEDKEVDDSGLREEDIENVMSHCGVSRAKAVKALRGSNGDPIDAILKFS